MLLKGCQLFLPGQIGGQAGRDLRGGAAHELVHPLVLAAQGQAGLLGPPEGLPPPQKSGELAVDVPRNSGKWTQRVGKGPVKSVARARPRAKNGAGGVVEGGPGVLVVLLPAAGPQDAFGADLVSGVGEDLRRVSVLLSSGWRVSFTLP